MASTHLVCGPGFLPYIEDKLEVKGRSQLAFAHITHPLTTDRIQHPPQIQEENMSPIAVSRRRILAGAAVAVPVGALSLMAPPEAYGAAEPTPSRAQKVVTRYFGILNAGMASANADFSALRSVYAEDAVLTQSSPAGVTNTYQGLDAVTGFYVAAWQNFHGITWNQDHVRNLANTVVLSYEHAGRPAQTKPGRCAHLFTVHRGLISSLDWVTYYPGVP